MKKQAFNPYLPSWEYIPDGSLMYSEIVFIYMDLMTGSGVMLIV